MHRTCLVVAVVLGCLVLPAHAAEAPGIAAAKVGSGYTFEILRDATWDAKRWDWKKKGWGAGMGLRKDGWLLTTAHQIKDAKTLVVICPDGAGRKADKWFWLNDCDLGVVHIPDYEVPVPTFGASGALRRGQPVWTVGRPYGQGRTLSHGIVSGLNRNLTLNGERPHAFQDYILTDIPVNPGNSGGPLWDDQGHVVGMVVATLSITDLDAVGMSFALASDVMVALAKRVLKERTEFRAGALDASFGNCFHLPASVREKYGITVAEGAVVFDVAGTAKAAGLRDGDVIVAVGSTPIRSWMHVRTHLATHKPGTKLTFRIQRARKFQTLTIELGAWDS